MSEISETFAKIRTLTGHALRGAFKTNFTCDVCGREVFGGERICAVCEKELPWILVRCPLCGRAVGESGICVDCKDRPLAVETARSPFRHDREAARLVLRFKNGQKYLAVTLADYLVPLLSEFEADALVFVPMTKRAERARGYNQSLLLAEELSKRSGLPLLPPLEKTRETEQQKALGRRARAENLKGCFHVRDRKSVRGRKVLIVDDTMTTGATAGELASVLKGAGAEKVFLITFTSVENKTAFGK